jgi:MOSC domain-containing protein YiiM
LPPPDVVLESFIMAHVTLLLISSSPASAMEAVEEVRAVPGRGLEGDRYFAGVGTFSPSPQKPDFELTLIEEEHIAHFAGESGLPFTAHHARRNIVTTGVNLNALAGREFFVGGVRVRGLRLCEPCNYLAKISWPETLRGLVHKGGLRARIMTEGIIRRGDEIRLEPAADTPPTGSDHSAAEC